LAAAEEINPSRVSRLLGLTLLPPEIVAAIPDGWQAQGMTLPERTEPFLVDWARQEGCPLLSASAPARDA
jgi:hypothetical protein